MPLSSSSSFSADGETESFVSKISPPPPSLPVDRVYTANYCEENVYLLVKRFIQDEQLRAHWRVYAVFISNKTKTVRDILDAINYLQVALWSQKLREDVVVWDYHVILALKARVSRTSTGREFGCDRAHGSVSGPVEDAQGSSSTWIYDLDSRLDVPCRWEDYVRQTFPFSAPEAVEASWSIPEQFWSCFRIVEGEEFLENFASDRSHMLVSGSDAPRYQSPLPPYPPIIGSKAAADGISNNLMSRFVSMDVDGSDIGSVYTLEQVKEFFG